MNNYNQKWDKTGISIDVIGEIRELGRRHHLDRIVLFGSRARGGFRRNSDIDLAVYGGDAQMFRLDVEEETSTLLQFDVVDMNRKLQPDLLKRIEQEGIVIYEKV